MPLNGIAFVPMHDREHSSDVSKHYAVHAHKWTSSRDLPAAYQFDNRKPRFVRTRTILSELTRKGPRFDAVAFFGYGGAHGLQSGFILESMDALTHALLSCTTDDSVIELHALDPVVDTSGLAQDGGFAHALQQRLHMSGKWRGQVIACVMNAHHEALTRIFEGPPGSLHAWLTTYDATKLLSRPIE